MQPLPLLPASSSTKNEHPTHTNSIKIVKAATEMEFSMAIRQYHYIEDTSSPDYWISLATKPVLDFLKLIPKNSSFERTIIRENVKVKVIVDCNANKYYACFTKLFSLQDSFPSVNDGVNVEEFSHELNKLMSLKNDYV